MKIKRFNENVDEKNSYDDWYYELRSYENSDFYVLDPWTDRIFDDADVVNLDGGSTEDTKNLNLFIELRNFLTENYSEHSYNTYVIVKVTTEVVN